MNKTEINGKNEYSKLYVSEVETDTPVCFVNEIYYGSELDEF